MWDMHRSKYNSFRGHSRPNFDERRRSPPRRFGFDHDGPGERRFDSFRNRSPPRGRPLNYPPRGGHRDDGSVGAPFSQSRPFGSNRPMYQLRVENLCGNLRDQVLKQELLHIFRQHGNCSVYVVDQGRGMSKEAYITYWSLDESRNARRSENEQRLFNLPMFISMQREPRVFGMNRPAGHSELRRESSDNNHRNDFRPDGNRAWSDGYRGSAVDDTIPTRTLFVGNLDSNTADQTLYEIFGKFGSVEHVDIKAPRNGASGTFAFVRYAEVSSAKEAKQELHQKLIGSSRIRLGYGRGTPSARIHISGLGAWCSLDWLEREFDRFGAIHHIEYRTGSPTALVSFDSVDAASAAAREMNKGDAEHEHSIVVSFAEGRTPAPGGHGTEWNDGESRPSSGPATAAKEDRESRRRRRRSPSESDRAKPSDPATAAAATTATATAAITADQATGAAGDVSAGDDVASGSQRPLQQQQTQQPQQQQQQQQKRRRDTSNSSDEPEQKRAATVSAGQTLDDASQAMQLVWTGALRLRKMSFPMRMFVLAGDASLASSYMASDVKVVTITQRLRLDAEKLEEVRRRMTSCGPSGHCVLLALAADESAVGSNDRTSDGKGNEDPDMHIKPLRNLVMFLKQKQAAGVAQLTLPTAVSDAGIGAAPASDGAGGDGADTGGCSSSSAATAASEAANGVLHAFPPGDFAAEQLAAVLSRTVEVSQEEDYLVIVIVSK